MSVCLHNNSYHNSCFLTLFLNTSSATTNRKGLSAKPTVTVSSADTPHSAVTLVVAPLYISSTNRTIGYGTPFQLMHQQCHFSGHSVKCFLEVRKCKVYVVVSYTCSLGSVSQFIWHHGSFSFHVPKLHSIDVINLPSPFIHHSLQNLHCIFSQLYFSIASTLRSISFLFVYWYHFAMS